MEENCYLVTMEFPYFNNETFLENEIKYLSKVYNHVYIFAINVSRKERVLKEIPLNVNVYPLGCVVGRKKYLVYSLSGLFDLTKVLKLSLADLKIKRIVTELYFKGRANSVYRKIKKIIKQNNLNISNATFYSYWFLDQAIAVWRLKNEYLKEGNKVKAVSRAHGYDLYWEISRTQYIPYQEISLKNLDGVYCCSENGKCYLKKKYPNQKEKIHISRLGTCNWGVGSYLPEKKVFVTCSSLIALKRITLFAEAFVKLSKTVLNCYWICIGNGEEFEKIRQIVSQNNISERVKFTGAISNKEVLEIYKNEPITYFCNISTSEGVPVSIMEAMSFGIPIIATDAGGTSELVSDEIGKIIPINIDSNELSNMLREQLEIDDELYRKKRENARKQWNNIASAEKNYGEWISILKNI